ncbi:MAG: hypothetical protein HC921_08840 [Synechococcaceae cyanobacterium SM2_3_1]|nr:hypothetical protein [Synechococcaceae cyanobacterium SM2_3_1]
MDLYTLLSTTQRQQVGDGLCHPLLTGCNSSYVLILIWPQLGDFDSLEYAWWIQRESQSLHAQGVEIRAIGIGNRESGQQFSTYTGFPAEQLFVDPEAQIHQDLGLYAGLTLNLPGLKAGQKAWVNLMLMCAGIQSPGTLAEVWRGYRGDRRAPQLIRDEEEVRAFPLPPLKGSFFNRVGKSGSQRPLELATLRLRNMAEVLGHWNTYVPDAAYLTQRGSTFLFDSRGELLYEYRDRGILGFAENMRCPLEVIHKILNERTNNSVASAIAQED